MSHCLQDGSLKQQRFRRILRFGLEVPGEDMLFAIRHQYELLGALGVSSSAGGMLDVALRSLEIATAL